VNPRACLTPTRHPHPTNAGLLVSATRAGTPIESTKAEEPRVPATGVEGPKRSSGGFFIAGAGFEPATFGLERLPARGRGRPASAAPYGCFDQTAQGNVHLLFVRSGEPA
jgi:hypothetical protein